MPYTLEFAKKVTQPKEKEKTLHALLERYAERVSPSHEFFRVSVEEVRTFFALMDGEMWNLFEPRRGGGLRRGGFSKFNAKHFLPTG